MTLERRNNDLGYSKDNCYWATRKQQAATRRLGNQGKHSHQSRLLTFNGKTQSIGAWSAELGAKPHSTTLHKRLDRYGWSIAKALTTPIRAWRNNDEPAVPKIGPKPAEVNFGSALVKEDAA
jgi:hypothetical protein